MDNFFRSGNEPTKNQPADWHSYLMTPAYSGLAGVGRETVAGWRADLHLRGGCPRQTRCHQFACAAAGIMRGDALVCGAASPGLDEWLAAYAATAAELPSLACFVLPGRPPYRPDAAVAGDHATVGRPTG